MIEKHGLQLVSTKGMPRLEWLERRRAGLGGSDIGTIMGVNKNFSRLELFYQKCGATLDSTEINPAMFWGNQHEDKVLEISQYLDLETQEYLANHEAGNKVRNHSVFKYMVVNPEYPWLIANIDGLNGFNKRTFKAKGIAEIKTISRQTAEMWETFPPYHYFQVQMYLTVLLPMLTSEEDTAIFYLKDGRELYGYPLPYSKEVSERIVEESYKFWQIVLEGKEIVQNTPDKAKQLQYLAGIEPDPEHNEGYLKFLSKLLMTKMNFKTIEGTDDILEAALAYKSHNKRVAEEMNKRAIHEEKIKNALRLNEANIIEFAGRGRITFNKKLYINVN
jgi:putative phage-type endonuclease